MDSEFYKVEKDFLKTIIKDYENKIKNYYKEMVDPIYHNGKFIDTVKATYGKKEKVIEFDFSKITNDEQMALYECLEHIRSMSIEWNHDLVINLDNEDSQVITNSWKYEYVILELVRIYKTFDWENDVMVYYGY